MSTSGFMGRLPLSSPLAIQPVPQTSGLYRNYATTIKTILLEMAAGAMVRFWCWSVLHLQNVELRCQPCQHKFHTPKFMEYDT